MNQNDLKSMFGSTPDSFTARIRHTLDKADKPIARPVLAV